MSISTTVYYRQPNHTNRVKGQRDVGRNGDGEYVSEAAIDRGFSLPEIGYGTGDTPAEAKRAAYASLARKLDAMMRGQ